MAKSQYSKKQLDDARPAVPYKKNKNNPMTYESVGQRRNRVLTGTNKVPHAGAFMGSDVDGGSAPRRKK